MKLLSFETIFNHFLFSPSKKYSLFNVASSKYIHVVNEQISLHNSLSSQFYVVCKNDILMRANIKLDTKLKNNNGDNSGWNLFTTDTSNYVFGKGNNDIWGSVLYYSRRWLLLYTLIPFS